MTFWIIVTLLALAVATLLVVALLRGRTGAQPAAAYDLRVYRDQLKDVDRDLARGVIGQADAERTRAEVSRRILAADAQVRQDNAGNGQPRRLSAAVAVALAAVLLGGSAWIYLALGAPEQRDLPLQFRKDLAEDLRRERPGQEAAEARMPARPAPEIEADYAALVEQLRIKVAERPDDLQGHVLLARHEANVGNYVAARLAQDRAIELMGENAGSEDYVELGELMILASGGYVSPQAEAALKQALERDPFNGPARYYWGLMQAQIGRPDLAFDTWERTLRRGPPDAPWLVPIRAQIEEMAWRAGVQYELPETPERGAGPSQSDMEAAGGMSAAERQAMIRGMVDGLAGRLAEDGGDAAEWARLISALAVLGEEARARKALEDARAAHDGDTEALAEIAAAARDAGTHPVICDRFEDFADLCPPGRAILGLDLGDKTIGVAVSDRIGAAATPLETIRRRKFTLDAERLLQIAVAREAGGILLGLPRNMDGSEGPRCQSTRAFARNLSRLSDLPIGFWDERLSTVAAERALLEADTSRKRRAEVIDHVAAGYILQGALDRMRHMRNERTP